MSVVEDVAARIRRLEETRTTQQTRLRKLQQELRYSAQAGVDERLDSGGSVARLELKVGAARNLLFKAGFLSGKMAYVRATLEVVVTGERQGDGQAEPYHSCVREQKRTTKRPVQYAPDWQEMLVFEGVPAAAGSLRVDIMQEERIGADELIGTFMIPLVRLQDQRALERWQTLAKHDKATISELMLGCRFNRSPILALELELELLQNQISELHLFLGRHQNLVNLPPQPAARQLTSPKLLQGKEVSFVSTQPHEFVQRSSSTRFSAVESFSPHGGPGKREHVEDVSMTEPHDAQRHKRQRVVVTEKQVSSLSDRLSNWLLPSSNNTAKTANTPSAPEQDDLASGSATSNQFFPFKQRQTPPTSWRPRRTGRPHPAAAPTPPKSPSTLQSLEKWLFTDKEGNPRALPFGRQAPSY